MTLTDGPLLWIKNGVPIFWVKWQLMLQEFLTITSYLTEK